MYAEMILNSIRFFMPWLLLLSLIGCGSFLCGNDILQEVSSPDGKYVATVFERNCGATTPYLRIVSLRAAGKSFDAEVYNDWVFKISEQYKIEIKWSDIDKLDIMYAGGGEVSTHVDSWNKIKISYP
jgi:hypothetical protein